MSTFVCILVTLIFYMSNGINLLSFQLKMNHLGYDPAISGCLVSLELICPLVFAKIVFKVVTRFQIKYLIGISILIRSLTLLFLSVEKDKIIIGICFVLLGISASFFYGAMNIWSFDKKDSDSKTLFFSILGVLYAIGMKIGPKLAEKFAPSISMGIIPIIFEEGHLHPGADMIFVSGLFCLLIVIIVIIFNVFIPKISFAEEKNANISFIKLMPKIRFTLLINLICGYFFCAIGNYLILYGLESGLNEEDAMKAFGDLMIASIIFNTPTAFIAKKIDVKKWILPCMFLSIISFKIFEMHIREHYVNTLFIMMSGAFMDASLIFASKLMFQKLDGPYLTLADTYCDSSNSIGEFLGVLLTGMFFSFFGSKGLFLSICFMSLIIAFLYLTVTSILYYIYIRKNM